MTAFLIKQKEVTSDVSLVFDAVIRIKVMMDVAPGARRGCGCHLIVR
jgi:hypothetical protein